MSISWGSEGPTPECVDALLLALSRPTVPSCYSSRICGFAAVPLVTLVNLVLALLPLQLGPLVFAPSLAGLTGGFDEGAGQVHEASSKVFLHCFLLTFASLVALVGSGAFGSVAWGAGSGGGGIVDELTPFVAIGDRRLFGVVERKLRRCPLIVGEPLLVLVDDDGAK